MKRVRVVAALLGGMVAGLAAGLLSSQEVRGEISRGLAVPVGRMAERMPDG